MGKRASRKFGKEWHSISNILIILIISISLLNVFIISGMSGTVTEKMAVFEEENRPADVRVTKLMYSGCESCYDINQALEQVNNLDVEVTEERELLWDSPEAQSLINQYGIDVLPTVVITGETEKPSIESSWGKIGEMKDDGAVIFTKQELPYYDVTKQAVVGLVEVTNLVDSSCTQCIDLGSIVNAFKQAGVTISEETTLEYDSQEAGELIERFGVQKIPALIISRDITEYSAVSQVWEQLGAVEKGDSYVLHALAPPYRDLESGEIKGLVELVNLVDSSCSDCYDVSLHKSIFQRFGVAVASEITHDINSTEGEALLKKYNITRVPTVLLSPETSVYSSLNQVWSQAGSIENDGWYIFRELSVLGEDIIYRDL